MRLVALHGALADPTRLRILNLLRHGPLCVCHVMDVLGEPQVKISKHLALLKAAGLVVGTRSGHWMIYRLAEPTPDFLLAALPLCDGEPQLARDARALKKLLVALDDGSPLCGDNPLSSSDAPTEKSR